MDDDERACERQRGERRHGHLERDVQHASRRGTDWRVEEEKVCAESEVWAHPLIQAITTFQPLPNLPRPMISSLSNTAYPLQSQTSIHYNTFDSATNTSYLPHSTLLNSATPVFQARISSHQKRSSTCHWPIPALQYNNKSQIQSTTANILHIYKGSVRLSFCVENASSSDARHATTV